MARVSRKRLDKDQLSELVQQLTEVLGRLTTRQANDFLGEFLGPEEKELLAKRLAMVVMIHEGHSRYAVAKALKVSATTATSIYVRYKRGAFKATLIALRKNKTDYLAFLNVIDSFLTLGGTLPMYKAKNHWGRIMNGSYDD